MELSANADPRLQVGEMLSVLVEDSVHIYRGAMVSINAAGYAQPSTDAASTVFIGVALEECDNTLTGHTQGGKRVRVELRGTFEVTFTGVAQSDVNSEVYVVDDATVGLAATTTNDIPVGRVVAYVAANTCRVAFQDGGNVSLGLAAHLADGSAAHAASAISVLDTDTLLAATEVEAAILEMIRERTVASTTTPLTLTLAAHSARTILYSPAAEGTITLPANGAAAGSWIDVIVLTNQTVNINAATADTLITDGNTAADGIQFGTADHKVGSHVRFISNGTVWIASNLGGTTMTVVDA